LQILNNKSQSNFSISSGKCFDTRIVWIPAFAGNCLDSRLRGNDGRLGEIVIPAKAGIQESMPELIEKLHHKYQINYNDQNSKSQTRIFLVE
jgi:hypothetical protein